MPRSKAKPQEPQPAPRPAAPQSEPPGQLVRMPLAALVEDPSNARTHDKANLSAIRASLEAFGQTKPLILAADDRTVLAGNGTLSAMRALGWADALCILTDLEGDEAAAYAIADNRTSELGKWDVGRRERSLDGLWGKPELQRAAWGEADDEVPRRKARGVSDARRDEPGDGRAQLVVSCRAEDRERLAAEVSRMLLEGYTGAVVQ